MTFTLILTNGDTLTGEIVGDGGMVDSYERAQQLIRHRIARNEPLVIETFRDNHTGYHERKTVDPRDVQQVTFF